MATKKEKPAVAPAQEETAAAPVVRKTRSTAKPAAKKTEPAAKSTGKPAAAVCVPAVYVQYENRQYDCAELVERCKADFQSKHKAGVISACRLYIKPEDGMVYYVINEIEDKLAL